MRQYEYLRNEILKDSVFVSAVSKVEVLGYRKLTEDERACFRRIFDLVQLIIPTIEIFDKAVDIRKTQKLTLGDSIVGATAIVHGLTIYARNVKDFEKIPDLKSVNPIR